MTSDVILVVNFQASHFSQIVINGADDWHVLIDDSNLPCQLDGMVYGVEA